MAEADTIRRKCRALRDSLSERARRLWAATEAQSLGYGGASLVAKATGISRSTIVRGMRELRSDTAVYQTTEVPYRILPLYPASGDYYQPCAWVNRGAVANDGHSWGQIKSLYR
jgi:hypothetical protein